MFQRDVGTENARHSGSGNYITDTELLATHLIQFESRPTQKSIVKRRKIDLNITISIVKSFSDWSFIDSNSNRHRLQDFILLVKKYLQGATARMVTTYNIAA